MAEQATGTGCFRLMYRSHDRMPGEGHREALGALFSQARSNNKKRDITGALLTYERWFVQVLEGDEPAVRGLFAHIETDPRHDTVALLEAGPVPQRLFARWSMADVAPDADEPDTFLIAHKDGISPAASLRPTPEQEAVLARMRTAARTGPTPATAGSPRPARSTSM